MAESGHGTVLIQYGRTTHYPEPGRNFLLPYKRFAFISFAR